MTPRVLLLVLGVVACSSAALFIKASGSDALLIAAYRLLLACVVLLPVWWRVRRRHPQIAGSRLWRLATPAGVLLAIHFWSWNLGVGMTLVANATLIVNLTVVAMPIVIWLLLREGIRRHEVLGTGIALAGTALLAWQDLHIDWHSFLGDAVCFGSMITFTCYLAWSRRCRELPTIWLYVPLVYLIAGLLCLIAGSLKTGTVLVADDREWLLMLGLAAIPTIIGHSILNDAMRRLPTQLVAVVNLGQFIPAGLLAWLLFAEIPGWLYVAAALLVIGGALVVIRPRGRGVADR